MQATLLGFAIALILALVAALVGPYFVDWNSHRAVLEAKASQLVGMTVHVAGDIDARILPFPSVSLGGVALGGAAAGDSRLRARSLRVELALGSLLRGEIRAVEMRLVKPEFGIGLDRQGRIDWPPVALAAETLSIDRLNIEDGRATLTDVRSGMELVLEQLWFDGEVRSLVGPIRGKGAFVARGGAYGYTVSAGRHGSDGTRVRLSLDTAERPLSFEADGLFAFEQGAPRFDGALKLSRPASSVTASGRAIAHEPWRLSGKVQANAGIAKLEGIEFQYGPDDRATGLTGTGEFVYGAEPHLSAELSGRQIDLDRMLAVADAPRRLPFQAVRAFGEVVGGALRPPWPVRLAVRADLATLGGAPLQGAHADLRSDGKDWRLERLEFRAPGLTQVRLNGRLYPAGMGLGFTGDASVDAGDPRTLLGWLAGQPGAAGQMKAWQARGTVTLGADRIAVERLHTDFGRGAVEGRAGYSWPAGNRPARLDAELKAAELDLDAVLDFGQSSLVGLGLQRPGEAAIAIDIGRARIAGFDAQSLNARLKFDAEGIAIERVAIADLGSASVEARGRIGGEFRAEDNITVDLDARQLNGVLSLAERFATPLAAPLRRLSGAQGGAKLRAVLSRERAQSGAAHARLDLTGRIGALRVNLLASAAGKSGAFAAADLAALGDAELRFGGQFEADDGGALLAALGLERVPAPTKRPGRLVLTANGVPGKDLRFDGRLNAGLIDAEGEGVARMPAVGPATVAIDRFAGTIGSHKVSGRFAAQFGDSPRVDGAIDAETLDLPAMIAAAAGMPAPRGGDAARWPQEPFASAASEVAGQIAFKARRAALAGGAFAESLQGVARIGRSGIAFEDIGGTLGKGRVEGRIVLTNETGGLSARARIALKDVEAAALFAAADAPPVAGKLQLQAELAGSGRSPAAFIGSLSGNGKVMLEGGRFAGLNPAVFEAAVRAAELGIPMDSRRASAFAAGMLESGTLTVTRAVASIGIAAGLARFTDISAQAAADIKATGSVDLAAGTVEALITLTGQTALSGAVRPEVQVTLRGALPAPQRTVDTGALANWLTMRAVEQQAKQIDAIERQERERLERERSVPPQPMPRTEAPQLPIIQPSDLAPPLPPPVSIPARPGTRSDSTIRPPGLIGAQN